MSWDRQEGPLLRFMRVPLLVLVGAFGVASAGSLTAVASSPPQFGTGTYKAVVMSRGSAYQSMWTVTVKAGRISGLSTWACCPGKRIDPLTGTVTGSRVVIHRDCSGQGMPADCRQTLTGTVKTNGIVSGTWSGSYAAGAGDTFSLTPARSP